MATELSPDLSWQGGDPNPNPNPGFPAEAAPRAALTVCGTLRVTAAGQAEGRGLQHRYPGDADGREVPLAPPAIPLGLGSPGLPQSPSSAA